MKQLMEKKSNIKDVCALLDMKSSKYTLIATLYSLTVVWFGHANFDFALDIDDVNKAFSEMHEEVELKMYKGDFDTAMSH